MTVQNDYRLRGYSLSANRPAAIASLSYDHASGVYLNASAIGALAHGGDPVLLGYIGNVGYAYRLSPRLSLDAGVVRSEYPNRLGGYRSSHYDEVYVGLLTGDLSSHIYVSPDYYRTGVYTLYAEAEGTLRTVAKIRLNAHAGVLAYLRQPYDQTHRDTQYDWRLMASRRLGAFDLHVALTGGGPGKDYYDRVYHGKTALVGGITWLF